MSVRYVRPGEALAIDQHYLRQSRANDGGPGAFFWLFSAPIKETEYREDGLAVVHVRGPLEHHEDPCSDSYDGILQRASEAFDCEEARAVVLCLDSPGGVVAGLNAVVEQLRNRAKASGKRFIAYVDEMATSAAYALACSCDEIVVPASAITGSIGVISTMVDVVAADEKMGIHYETIASGTRKTDGHPHVAITDAAMAAEAKRVEKLAMQFFRMVKTSRGVPVEKIRGFQAGIFLGKEAIRAGLADAVMTYDELMATLCDSAKLSPRSANSAKPLAQGGTGEPHSALAQSGTHVDPESPMPVSLDALIKRTEASAASEKDPKRKAELAASLEAYKKTKHSIEKHETEEGEEDDEDEEDEESEESEESESKGNETDRGDDPDDDEDDGDDEDEKKSKSERRGKRASLLERAVAKGKITQPAADALARKSLITVKRALGIPAVPRRRAAAPARARAATATAELQRLAAQAGPAAQGALEGLLASNTDMTKRLDKLERSRAVDARNALVDKSLAENRVTKIEAKQLRAKPIEHVRAFLEARPRGLVYSQDDDMPVPNAHHPDMPTDLSEALEKQIAAAVQASEGKITREQFLADYAKRQQSSLNGRS